MFITNPLPEAFGLDIGDLSVKLVQLKRHAHPGRPIYFTVQQMRSVGLPNGAIINGEILQPEVVRKKILHILGKDGAYPKIKSPWVVADLPEPQTFLKVIEIPVPRKDLVFDEIASQATKHLPFEIKDTYLDWQAVDGSNDEESTKVIISAVPKNIADSFTYLLEAAGLNPLALEAESVAVSRALITASKDYSGIARALLDLGGTRSCIIIYDHDYIQFSKSLSFSGEMFTTALAQGLKIEREEAEKLKVENGLKYNSSYPNYLKSVEPLVNELVTEIRETIRFYKDHFPEANPITHITMCGGSSNLANLDTVISQKIKISSRPASVWKNLHPDDMNNSNVKKDLDYAPAIGLALRAAQNPLLTNHI